MGVLTQEKALLYSADFESGQLEGWKLGSGWEIAENEDGHALAGQGHVLATYTAGSWSDYRLRFKVKLTGNGSLHTNFRSLEGPTRYFIGLNREGLYISKQTGPESFSENLANAEGLGSGWKNIEISGYGPTVSVSVNRKAVMEYTDLESILSGVLLRDPD